MPREARYATRDFLHGALLWAMFAKDNREGLYSKVVVEGMRFGVGSHRAIHGSFNWQVHLDVFHNIIHQSLGRDWPKNLTAVVIGG